MRGIGVWFAAGVPLWLPVGVGEPADGADHRSDGLGHVGEVDRAEFVAGLVVVLVQAEAGDGVGDDTLVRERVVIGSLKEVLRRVRVVDQMGAMFGEFRAEVGAFEAGEPERSGGDRWVGPADHLELEVGDDAGERDRRVREEGAVAKATNLFRAEECEDDGATRARAGRRGCGPG